MSTLFLICACVKVKTPTGEKVFINVCSSPLILELISMPETYGENTYFFPKVYSKIRLETVKADNQCKTFDVIINDQYFNDIKNSNNLWEVLKRFLLQNLPYTDLTIDIKTLTILKN